MMTPQLSAAPALAGGPTATQPRAVDGDLRPGSSAGVVVAGGSAQARGGVIASRRPRFSRPFRLRTLTLVALALLVLGDPGAFAQKRKTRIGPRTSHSRDVLSAEAREMIGLASAVVCKERLTDPKGSVPIDDMQARPSLPIQSPEAVAGARRAQRLLPIAKNLVEVSLRRLTADYKLGHRTGHSPSIQRAIARVRAVRSIRPDMDSRDNASVFLKNPHTIIFGTIFLAGLPSDEGIISVLAHELVHIGDGGEDNLRFLFRAVGNRASRLTSLKIHGQPAEELTCDLVGTLASRFYVSATPSYEPLPRRISRSLAHNCVDQDEGDDDHLSPKITIRALLTLNPTLSRELVYGR